MKAEAQTHADDQAPIVGGYRLGAVVAEKPGHHVVYDGVNGTGGRVSVKVFAGEADRRTARRFARAARRRGEVRHRHLLTVHGASEWDGRLVLVTEPCDLPTMADRLEAGPMAPEETIRVLGEVAEALDVAADAGLVDHELSPETIMLDPLRGVLLGDLGVAASLEEGLPAWAYPFPDHAPPEVTREERLERRSNVYSLASVMLECLTGRPPFEGDIQLVVYSHAAEAPPRASERDPSLGEEIDEVLGTALTKDPADRFSSARALVDAAATALGVARTHTDRHSSPRSASVQAPVAQDAVAGPEPRRQRPSRRTGLAIVALPLAAAVAVGGYLAGDTSDTPRPAPRQASPAGPAPELVAAARTIDQAVVRLDRSARFGRARLAGARTPAGQARTAARLARAYRSAGATVAGAGAPQGLDPRALRGPLADASRAYVRLASAARAQSRSRYNGARRDIAAAEARLRRTLTALR